MNRKLKFLVFSLLGFALILFGISFTVMLTGCTTSKPGDLNQDTIINQIFPNVWVLVAQLLAGVIMFLVILLLIWKPTNQMLERRQKLIKDEIDGAQELKQSAQTELENAKNKAKLIIEQSYSLSVSMVDNAESEAKLKAEQTINSANELIKQEKIKIKNDAEKEIVEVIFKTVEELIKKNVSRQDNDKLVKDFIKGLSTND